MEDKHSISTDMPIGFGLSLAANAAAMKVFSGMTDEEKRQVIEASRNQTTKEEMIRFVADIEHLS